MKALKCQNYTFISRIFQFIFITRVLYVSQCLFFSALNRGYIKLYEKQINIGLNEPILSERINQDILVFGML